MHLIDRWEESIFHGLHYSNVRVVETLRLLVKGDSIDNQYVNILDSVGICANSLNLLQESKLMSIHVKDSKSLIGEAKMF